ncbi:exonuclease SbcCD subunit D [Thalassotalea ponticola]|uniref:exonuclease SbcCD subunit D n=1 Tax=Thalassotalea ponticola TaxID=1523392 RepID=UPI0025B57E42|nr:exonuclease SbcCD subunit D [Thalassotalea ponticola]MDN3652530.1 exonuclease SbcCD subunit D [Thalassotalea ponticola]
MRFIHTSDWHIGRLFQNQSLLDDQVYILEQIKQYLVDHQVDALVIAGDIFDRSVPPSDAVDVLDRFINQVAELDIRVIIISGNHDSAKRLRFGAKQMHLSGVHIVADLAEVTEPIIVENGEQQVAFYGIPYHDPNELRFAFADEQEVSKIKSHAQAHDYCVAKVLAHKQQHYRDIPAVLMSHCFVDGASESDSERPLSIGGADRVAWQPMQEFTYVALGHLHGPQYRGKSHIRYSGSPLKYSFSEHRQQKSVTLVDIDENHSLQITQLPLQAKRDVKIIEGPLQQLIAQGQAHRDEHGTPCEHYYLARLTDTELMLDPMGQLRAVFPNVLQLERVNFNEPREQSEAPLFANKKSELDVFADFYQQVMGIELTEPQREIMSQCVSQAKAEHEGE